MFNKKIKEKLYCHNCGTYQIFEFDLRLEGKQVFNCPKCGHPHYRVLSDTGYILAQEKYVEVKPLSPMALFGEDNELQEIIAETKTRNITRKTISNERWDTAN